MPDWVGVRVLTDVMVKKSPGGTEVRAVVRTAALFNSH